VKKLIRIDKLLVEKGLVESRNIAQRFIMAGEVRVAGQIVFKPSHAVDPDAEISIDPKPRYVSQGGEKLEHALRSFNIEITGAVCADVGASTGGFTDCLLQHGAKRVYSIDVGHGQLHWKLRNDPRIVIMERTNARYLETLPENVKFVTIDVSFISLRLILPAAVQWIEPQGSIIALVKPQFEAGRESVGRGGIVRDPVVHSQVLMEIITAAEKHDLFPKGLVSSPILKLRKNVEFLLWLSTEKLDLDIDLLVETAISSPVK
jgi:23S rRNA (cytidine1920-2'-O)/16S rRNA (cytidine1409-2'-O)-methyltransferase